MNGATKIDKISKGHVIPNPCINCHEQFLSFKN